MLEVLTNFDPPPESVPINCLMAMPGTPLDDQPPVDIFELVRLIAITRIALAESEGAPERRPHAADARRPGAVLLRRRELDLLRGQAAHRAQPAADADVALLGELGLRIQPNDNSVDLSPR